MATSNMYGEWKQRSVVSSFIMKYKDGKPRVALFQRSDKVSTYRYVEKDDGSQKPGSHTASTIDAPRHHYHRTVAFTPAHVTTDTS